MKKSSMDRHNGIGIVEYSNNQLITNSKINEFIELLGQEYSLFLLNLENYNKGDVENNFLIYQRKTKQNIDFIHPLKEIFLSHFYTEIPHEFNQLYFVEQLKCYIKNTYPLAHLHGFVIIEQEDNFLPIVFTERPINGPLQNRTKLKDLTTEQKFIIIASTIEGIAFIHKQNFIHSNLNPMTVYLNEDDQPVICDYIFVPHFKVDSNKNEYDEFSFKYSIEKNEVQKVFKNSKYVAPEILNGGEFSWQSDIFSLGILIFYILTGEEATFSEKGEIEYPLNFSDEWKKLINKCTSIDPSKRPTAMEVLNILLDENKTIQFISSMTPESKTTQISEKTNLILTNIKLNVKNGLDTQKKEIEIFRNMIPDMYVIDEKTRLLISAAEKGDIECIEKVGDLFLSGEKNFIQDDMYAYKLYKIAAQKGSLYSILQIARFNEEGIGKALDLKMSLKYYEDSLKIMTENDPRRSKIQSKIKELKSVVLSNIPLNVTKNDIINLFKEFHIKIINDEKHEKFQKMTIQFDEFVDIKKVKFIIKKTGYKIERTYIGSFVKKQLNSLTKYLPKININQFYPGKGNDSYKLIGRDDFANIYLVYKKDTEKPFVAKVFYEFDYNVINDFKKDIIITSKLNHPAFIKYIGFSDINFIDIKNSKELQFTLFTEFYPEGNLEDIIQNTPEKLNNTNKLKAIIGLVRALLEMYNIIFSMKILSSRIILFNEKFEPVISNLFVPINKNNDKLAKNDESLIYLAPELYNADFNNIAGFNETGIYSFGIILYQILTLVSALDIYHTKDPKKLMSLKFRNYTPQIPDNLHEVFKYLIKSCWNISINERLYPSIIYDLLIEVFNSSEPLLPNVNREEVEEYINKLNIYQSETTERNMYEEIRYLMFLIKQNNPIAPFQLCSIFYEGKYLSNNLKKRKIIAVGQLGEIFIFENDKTNEQLVAEILFVHFSNYNEEEKIQIMTNLSISLQLNHSCICRCLGFYPYGFNKEKYPIIFNEYMKNGCLFDIIDDNNKVVGWNNTKKLINIYGIASGMSYLHSHNILHQNLNTQNILLDDQLYPKINNCCISNIFNSIQTSSKIIEISPFIAPEFFEKNEYTKASEVYSFGMIVHCIITNTNPKQNLSQYHTLSQIIEGDIHQSNESIPEIYSELIERCLSKNPEERPTFDEILNELQNKREYIDESIDVKQFNDFIEYTKSYKNNDGPIESCPEQVIKEWLYNKQSEEDFKNSNIFDDEEEEEEEYLEYEDEISFPLLKNINTIQLKKIQQQKLIKNGGFGVVYKVIDKSTKKEYAAKVLNIYVENDPIIELKFIREVICHSQVKNQTITKFIGYNRHYLHNISIHPVIFTEYISKGDLKSILENERKGIKIKEWNDTQKLIVIYGIAYGMLYLHSIGILHRDLNPSNILLDNSLFPKICDFGLSKNIDEKDYCDELKELITKNHNDNQKSNAFGTPGFIAPEIYIENKYSMAGDVYAFAFLVYEILTAEDPFAKLEFQQDMFSVVMKKRRPKFVNGFDRNYFELITNCWKDDPEERPTFQKIVEDLQKPKFITEKINQKAFIDYVEYIQKEPPI